MSTVLNLVVPILAGLFLLAAAFFFLQGLTSRRAVSKFDYGVARQEARQLMAVSFTRAVILFFVSLILLGIFGLASRPEGAEPQPTLAPTAEVPTTEPTDTPGVTPSVTLLQQTLPTPTDVLETPTPSPEPAETGAPITPTVASNTAVVNSPNGLWLRERAGGTQELELIPDGTVLELLPGRETVDDLEWQQVRTPAGNEGWVAVDFILYQ